MSIGLVVTSIAAPNDAMRSLAHGCMGNGYRFFVIGDVPSPADYYLEGCDFYGLQRQITTGFKFARVCPTRHYSRKNIGYLAAMATDCSMIVETDDDNIPLPGFWRHRQREGAVRHIANAGWVNVYSYFSETNIWPRGFLLDQVQTSPPVWDGIPERHASFPIQQGLANGNPDVDAIYRLLFRLPITFQEHRSVALGEGSWCPFNSQNTAWWPEAYPLLYLPSCCSFRMTDIWRSFVAQRIAWTNGWSVLFHSATVYQERNTHDLMRDFHDEVPGYESNRQIVNILASLSLRSGCQNIPDNMRTCYGALINVGLIGQEENHLLDAWLEDVNGLQENLRQHGSLLGTSN